MKQITSYYELINAFRQFAEDHKQIKCFGYGTLTDIESPMDPNTGHTVPRDYPYLFINPTNHTYTNSMLTYRFNMIVMELTSETTPMGFPGIHNTIKAQSDSLKILNDFMAWLEYNEDWQIQLVKNTAFTPFQERFQDTVAGMTATIEIQVPNRLDLCDAPIYFNETLILSVEEQSIQSLDITKYIDGTAQYETQNWWPTTNTFTTEITEENIDNLSVELRADLTMSEVVGESWPSPFVIEFEEVPGVFTTLTPDVAEWPTAAYNNQNVQIKLVWNNLKLDWNDATDFDRFKFRVADVVNTTPIWIENLQIKFYQVG